MGRQPFETVRAMREDGPGRPAGEGAWAWIVADGTGLWVFGAAAGSPANAWALGVAGSDAHSVEQLRALEAVRESGQITLVRASPALFEAWKALRSRLGCRLLGGVAVTLEEHGLALPAGGAGGAGPR